MEKEVSFSGEINNRSFGITQETFERLLKLPEKNRSNAIALYNFYSYTAKFQKTNQVYCTTSFAAKALGWGESKIIETKKSLKEINLIEDFKDRFEDGTLAKPYVIVKFLLRNNTTTPVKNQSVVITGAGETTDKCLVTNTLNALLPTNVNACADAQKTFSSPKESVKPDSLAGFVLPEGWSSSEEWSDDVSRIVVTDENGVLVSNSEVNRRRRIFKQEKRRKTVNADTIADADYVVRVIRAFEAIDPTNRLFYNHKGQRDAASFLIEQYGLSLVLEIIASLPETNSKNYFPTITNPFQLKMNWVKLISAKKKQSPKVYTNSNSKKYENI